MRFQVFFCNLLVCALVKECIQELKLLFAGAFSNDGDEIDELCVINWTVKLAAVLNHEEDLVGEIRVLDFHQSEVLKQFPLADHIVFT